MSTISFPIMTTYPFGCHDVSTFRGVFVIDTIFDHLIWLSSDGNFFHIRE